MPEVLIRTWQGEFVLRTPWTGGHRPPDVDPLAVLDEAVGDRFVAAELYALAERVRGTASTRDVARVLSAAVEGGSLELVCCPTQRPLASVMPASAIDLASLADDGPLEPLAPYEEPEPVAEDEPPIVLHLHLDVDDGVRGHLCLEGSGPVIEVPMSEVRHGMARFEDVHPGQPYRLVHVADDGTRTLVADETTLDRLLDAIEAEAPPDDFEPLDIRPLRRDDGLLDDDLADPTEARL